MKNGLFFENDELIYYKNGKPYHAGVIEVDGAIYYISSKGRAVRGKKTIHRDRANGLLDRGHYIFDDNYKLVEGSFRPIKKQKGYRIRMALHKLKKNKVFKAVFKKKNIVPAIAVVCSVWLLSGLVQMAQIEKSHHPDSTLSSTENTDTQTSKISLPTFEEEVLLTSETVKQLYDYQISVSEALSGGNPYQPFVFNYDLNSKSGTLLISENESFSDRREFVLVRGSANVSIDNLKAGTTYCYRVLVDGEVYEGSFETARSIRFVYIPGIKNTRDIGGYTTPDGSTVKQGLLIRGLEIDGLVEPTYFIPKESLEAVQETFGFVYDFDLREASIYSGKAYQSRLGKDVGHKFYNSPQYGEIFRPDGLAKVRDIFRDLAKPENYPMYLHCTYGTDRTGTIVFLLQGLLGMAEEDMVREYQLTAFFNADLAESHNMDIIINGMQSYAGDTLQEKIEAYFLDSVGLTQEEIESIRSIFLE